MNAETPSKPRGRGKAAALLAGVYLMGIVTGVGGGLFVMQRQVHRVLQNPPENNAPVDYLFAQFEADIARKAALAPEERTLLHERMQVLSREFKGARLRLATDLRAAVQREVSHVTGGVDPSRRERVREVLRQRLQRWGVEPRGPAPATPEAVKNL